MKLLYFAWIRTKTGIASEVVQAPPEVRDVASLLAWLKSRGENFAAALADPSVVRVAVNREYAAADHPIRPEDEVALFPPVSGGAGNSVP